VWARRRQAAAEAAAAGRVEEAVAAAEALAPGALAAQPAVLFRLQCQRFLELVRRARLGRTRTPCAAAPHANIRALPASAFMAWHGFLQDVCGSMQGVARTSPACAVASGHGGGPRMRGPETGLLGTQGAVCEPACYCNASYCNASCQRAWRGGALVQRTSARHAVSLCARCSPTRQSVSQGSAGMVQVRARDDKGAMAYGRAVLSGAAASDQDQELLQARRGRPPP